MPNSPLYLELVCRRIYCNYSRYTS